MPPAPRLVCVACCAALFFAVPLGEATVTSASAVVIPKKATYVGQTSQKHVAAIFVSKNGTRIGMTIWVTARCTNGTTLKGTSWSTEGQFYDDYWIRPKRDGTFGLNAGNTFATTGGGRGEASGRFKGRFKTAKLVTGTFRGHVDYRSAAGGLLYSCDTGPLTWTARR